MFKGKQFFTIFKRLLKINFLIFKTLFITSLDSKIGELVVFVHIAFLNRVLTRTHFLREKGLFCQLKETDFP